MRNNRRRSSSARQSEAEESGTPPTVGEGDEDGDGKLPTWAPSWAVRQRIRDLVRAHRAGPECWPGWPRPREASGGLESPAPRQSPTRCPFRVPVRHFRSHLRSSSVFFGLVLDRCFCRCSGSFPREKQPRAAASCPCRASGSGSVSSERSHWLRSGAHRGDRFGRVSWSRRSSSSPAEPAHG